MKTVRRQFNGRRTDLQCWHGFKQTGIAMEKHAAHGYDGTALRSIMRRET